MDKFLSCDWGTTSFRLRLVSLPNFEVIAEEKSGQGIAETYRLWQQQSDDTDRVAFYTAIIKSKLELLSTKLNTSLQGIPIVLSGMASSTMGLVDLPYKKLPFAIDGADLEVKRLDAGKGMPPLLIISGAASGSDFMRGEETKVVGCAGDITHSKSEQLLIVPGTHPKHITVNDNKVTDVKTYMTGEFFDLLSRKSVLSASVEQGTGINDPGNKESFTAGVKAALTDDLLHAAFMIRTKQVLNEVPKQQNFYYLSGLLIGTELKNIKPGTSVYLVSGQLQSSLYTLACAVLGIDITRQIDADLALIKGQYAILSNLTAV